MHCPHTRSQRRERLTVGAPPQVGKLKSEQAALGSYIAELESKLRRQEAAGDGVRGEAEALGAQVQDPVETPVEFQGPC